MWDGLFMLLALSTIMGTASFLAGILPLSFSLSQKQLRFISLLGTGVLVGTSLIVIIPEGIETMYSAGRKGGSHGVETQAKSTVSNQRQGGSSHSNGFSGIERSEALKASFPRGEAGERAYVDIIVERTPQVNAQSLLPRSTKEKEKQKEKEKKTEENHPLAQKGGDDDSTEGHKEGHTRVHAPEGEEKDDTHGHSEEQEHHAYIGVALILGFILMFLVDHLPEAIAPSKQQYHPLHISLSDLSRGPHNSSTASLSALNTPVSPMPERMPAPPPKSSATTVGLIIHAFADGIALGASSTVPSTSLSFIIFLAIMLHKAPAAFGLTSVLLRKGLSKRTARTHLIMFSLSAPAGAVFTWAVVHILGRTTLGGDDGLTWTTGWVLLFSGGTFLYVAMHAMTEATSAPEEVVVNGYMDSHHGARSTLTKSDIAVTLVGMLVPLVTQIGHVH